MSQTAATPDPRPAFRFLFLPPCATTSSPFPSSHLSTQVPKITSWIRSWRHTPAYPLSPWILALLSTPWMGNSWPWFLNSAFELLHGATIHKFGPVERIPPGQDQSRGQVEDCIQHPSRPLRIPGHAFRPHQCPSCVSSSRQLRIPGLPESLCVCLFL